MLLAPYPYKSLATRTEKYPEKTASDEISNSHFKIEKMKTNKPFQPDPISAHFYRTLLEANNVFSSSSTNGRLR